MNMAFHLQQATAACGQSCRAMVICVTAASVCQLVLAEEGDGLKLVAATEVRHDSNIFRLSPSQDAASLTGRPSKAETIISGTAGLRIDKQYGLQHIKLELDAVDHRYQHFDFLSFSAFNYRGLANWSITPHFYGSVTATRENSLNSYADFRNFNARNERIDTNYRVDATYELDARWRLAGAAVRTSATNKLPLLTETSYRQNSIEVGPRYVLPSNSSAGIIYRRTEGTYTDAPPSASALLDSRFSEQAVEVDGSWIVTPKTNATLRVGHRSRTHPNFSVRNFTGLYGTARLNWALTGKTGLTALLERDIAATQSDLYSYAQYDHLALGPIWDMTEKTRLGLQFGAATRDYKGSPGLVAPQPRRDKSYDTTLTLDWRPRPLISLTAYFQNQRRTANVPGADFGANIVNVSAQISF